MYLTFWSSFSVSSCIMILMSHISCMLQVLLFPTKTYPHWVNSRDPNQLLFGVMWKEHPESNLHSFLESPCETTSASALSYFSVTFAELLPPFPLSFPFFLFSGQSILKWPSLWPLKHLYGPLDLSFFWTLTCSSFWTAFDLVFLFYLWYLDLHHFRTLDFLDSSITLWFSVE